MTRTLMMGADDAAAADNAYNHNYKKTLNVLLLGLTA